MSPDELGRHILALTQAPPAAKPAWIQVLDAIGTFVERAGWPVVALVALIILRKPLSRLRSAKLKDYFSIDIDRELEQAAKDAPASDKPTPPTAEEVAKSGEIERLVSSVDLQQLRQTALGLAAEYERVRASMLPGDRRTRRMEVVVSKMRALGRAIIPLRYELRSSESPGQRLLAIASYQVAPDYDALEWLVERIAAEKPFVGYHAAVALVVAARDQRAENNLDDLQRAVAAVIEVETRLPADSDRSATLGDFKSQVQSLAMAGKP